ncbi:hypothetical protein D3C78_754200 [compost metagenome]
MASALQLQEAPVVHTRQRRLHLMGEPCLRVCEIDLSQLLQIIEKILYIIRSDCCKLLQNFLNLALLASLQLTQLIIHGNDRFRLYKQGSSRTGLIMHDTAKMRTIFLLNRYYITIAAKGNDGILKHLLHRAGADHLLQPLAYARFSVTELPPYRG